MSPAFLLSAALALLNLAFLSGGVYVVIKQTEKKVADAVKQINGVGAKTRELDANAARDYTLLVVTAILAESDKARQFQLAQFLLGGKR